MATTKRSDNIGRVKSEHARAAAAIRVDLKRAFPGVKFRVTSDSFSMGNSVDVRWTDGPTSSDVDLIIRRYQYGHFDGMQDLYEYSNRRGDIPQAKYVMGHRSMSDQTIAEIKSGIMADYFPDSDPATITDYTPAPNGYGCIGDMIWREFSKRSYCEPAHWMHEEREDKKPEDAAPVEEMTPAPDHVSTAQPQEVDPEAELDELIRSMAQGMMQLEAMACITEVRQ